MKLKYICAMENTPKVGLVLFLGQSRNILTWPGNEARLGRGFEHRWKHMQSSTANQTGFN